MYMWSFRNNRMWFLVVPLAMALFVFGPYWVWNALHAQAYWWRIPVISATFFDTPAYLQWLGQVMNGLDISQHLRWFEYPLRALARLVPQASVSEVWLLSRWISITVILFLSGWAVRIWTGLDTSRSRMMATAFWLSSVLAIGMRPGVFSWYLPFGIVTLTAPLYVLSALRKQAYGPAAFWTAAVVLASSVYAWFLVVAVLWLASIWAEWLLRRSRTLFFALTGVAAAASVFAARMAAVWLTSTQSGRLFWELQFQDGIGFTHLPQLTNSFVGMAAWVLFIFFASRNAGGETFAKHERRLVLLQWAWIAVFLAWISSCFTGAYIHNDHFRTPVLIMSWMSLAVWWSVAREGRWRLPRSSVWGLWTLCGISAVFVLNIIRQPYAFNHDYLNVIHLSVWLTILMALWLVLRGPDLRVPSSWLKVLMIGSFLVGGLAAVDVYAGEFRELPNRLRYVATIEWIEEHVPVDDVLCSDPVQAELLASFTGRRAFPSNATAISRKSLRDGLETTRAYASGFDATASGNESYLTHVNQFSRGIICEQFVRQVTLLKTLGFSADRVDDISGCPRDLLNELDAISAEMFRQTEVDATAFHDACPWVVISSDQRSFWRLPDDYREIPIDATMTVWHASP